jgi:MFS family permease
MKNPEPLASKAVRAQVRRSLPRANRDHTTLVLFAALFVFAMGQSMLFALVGPLTREAGLRDWQAGVIVSAASMVFLITSPAWGRLADRWGRRNVIVAGFLGYAVASATFAAILGAGIAGMTSVAVLFLLLVGVRVVHALLSGGIQPSAVGLVAETSSEAGRSAKTALITAGFGLGTVAGPVLVVGSVGLSALTPMFFVSALALLIAVLCALVLPPPSRPGVKAGPSSSASFDFWPLLPLYLLMAGTCLALGAIQQTTAFYILDFTGAGTARGAQLSGYAFAVMAAGMLIVQGGVVPMLKMTPPQMLAIGFPVAIAGAAAFLAAPSLSWIIAASALIGLGFGFLQPGITAEVSLRVGRADQSLAAGYLQSAMAAGYVAGPVIGTLLYQELKQGPMLLAICSLAACCFLGLTALRRRSDPSTHAPE